MAEKMIRWGMIGCGNVTEKKSAPAFSKIPGSRLVAVGSRTPGRAEDYARRHGVPVWHKDPYEVIRNPGVDIVYIATPPGSHLEYALEAISAGKPVYIEKPMARTWQECLVINDMAEEKNVPVYVAYYRRALEYFNRVKEIIDSGSLGRTLAIHIQQYFPARPEDYNRVDPPWRVVPEISGGGYFHDVGCHALDILFYLFGDPVSVMGTRINVAGIYQAEDTVSAILRLPGEVVATAGWSFIVPEACHKDLVEVTGEKGRIRFSIFSFRPISLQMGNLTEAFPVVQPEHIQMPLIRSIVRALNGEGTCPSTGTTAAVTSRVMDEILGRQ